VLFAFADGTKLSVPATAASPATTADRFTALGPPVTAIGPASGLPGTTVTVTGTDLTGASEVVLTIGTAVLTVAPTTSAPTLLVFTTPAGAPSLLHQNLAVAKVQVGLAGAGGSVALSPVVTASHFTFQGP
jgi:hypothetical protein